MKTKNIFKKITSLLLVFMIIIPIFNQLVVSAEEAEKYPYNLFGRNGITMNASNLCVNGSIHTNKTAEITANNRNINGKVTTGSDINKRVKHVYSDVKIQENYFMENCDLYEEEYVRSEMNIHINNPIFSYNNINLNGNVALNSNIGTLMNINVTGEVKNANNSVVYSKYGNITIENDSTANINGLIYVPLGTLTINSPNINLNGIIIADKIVINGSSVNINNNDNIARFIGTTSEIYDFSGLEYLPEDWLGDSDADELFDIYEKVIDTDPLNPDTDVDELPDGYEVLALATDPLEVDTDLNGIWDKDEDFDSDNLNNLGEYQNGTEPFIPDTDEDGLLDGDEVHIYGTNPMKPDTDDDKLLDGEEGYNGTIYSKYGIYFDPLIPDTDNNGVLDGDEIFGQSKEQEVITHDNKITEINVDMSINGNIERNLNIESMYNIDAMSTNVFALIGEPFNFTTSSNFDSATIKFTVDQSKLGDTNFDDLIILWYNEENQSFDEMPTTKDSANSTVSTTTTHFSQYMVVDSVKWYENWENSNDQLRKMWIGNTSYQKNLNTIFLIDCSTNMKNLDSIGRAIEVGYNGVTAENVQEIRRIASGNGYVQTMLDYGKNICDRVDICENIISKKKYNDRGAVITFSNEVETNTGWSNSESTLVDGVQRVHNDGSSSNLNAAITEAMTLIDDSMYDAYRIVVITHSDISVANYLRDYNWNRTDVNIVNLGPGNIMQYVENFTQHTGGEVYNSIYVDDLVSEDGETIYTPPKFVDKDYDEDGIPDIVEEYGLKPNGESIGTKKDKKDSDDDGIDDNVELHYFPDRLVYPLTPEQSRIMCSPVSDPAKPDSDDDGIDDGEDLYPNKKADNYYYFMKVDDFNYTPDFVNLPEEKAASEASYGIGDYSPDELSSIYVPAGFFVGTVAFPACPDASSMLKHFLNNTGEDYDFDVSNLIDKVSPVNSPFPPANRGYDLYNENMQKALDYAKSIVKDGETLIFSSSKALLTHDKMYYPRDLAMCSALGNSSGAIVMSFTRNGDIYSATMRYIVFDFYDWAENSNATGVPFLGITDGDLYKLHSAGWAKHFYVYGEVLVKIRGI